MKKLVQLLFLLFLTTTPLFSNPNTDFENANTAYQSGDYEQAIALYEKILQSGSYSSAVYYNLGNSYFKAKQLGKAILNYERGLLIAPNDADLQFNLEIANAKKKDDLDRIGKFFLAEWWRGLHQFFGSTTWGVLAILSLWASVGGFILWLFGASRARKKQGFVGGSVLLILSVFLYFVADSQAKFEDNSGAAILLVKNVTLKNAPDEQSSAILDLHEGLKVELLDQIGDWHKVKLSNGEQGWLPSNSLEEI